MSTRSSWLRTGFLGVAICLVSTPSFPQTAKQPSSDLDALVFANPNLRVVETLADSGTLRLDAAMAAAIDRFKLRYGSDWRFLIDRRTGRINLMDGGAIPFLPGPTNRLLWRDFSNDCHDIHCLPRAKLESLAREFMRHHRQIFNVQPSELILDPDGSLPTGDSVYLLRFQWTPYGLPVSRGSVFFRINNGNLVQVGMENLGTIDLDPTPSITRDAAWSILSSYARLGKNTEIVDRGSLLIQPVTPDEMDPNLFDGALGSGISFKLVYRLAFRRAGVLGTWEALLDAHTGRLLRFSDANRYGGIRGGVYKTDKAAAQQYQTESSMPMPLADYGPGSYSDRAGTFPGTTGTSTLTGPPTGTPGGVTISDTCGSLSLGADPTGLIDFGVDPNTVDCATPGIGGLGNTHATRTQYWNVTQIKIKASTYLPGNTWLQGNVTDNVNLNQTCNAYWDGTTLNFFRSGGGCWNTGELPGVSLHEWGHGMDTFDGSGGNSPPVETRADWTAILQTHQSCAGGGFFWTLDRGCGSPGASGFNCSGYGDCCTGCSGIRDADWAAHASAIPWTPANNGGAPGYSCSAGGYNGPCGWEDHCESGIASQALWDFVNRDLVGPPTNMDLVTAWQLADRLFYAGMPTMGNMYTCTPPTSDGCAAGSLYTVMRALDDDGDGTANGTPHAAAIYAALARHNIACGAAGDPTNQNYTSCPSLNTPTLSGTPGNNSCVLNWTSGGPNATRYFVYRNVSGCSAGYTKMATVNAPTLTFTDTNCVNGVTYYYRVQAATANDSCVSPMSNCVALTPVPCAGTVLLDQATYNCNDVIGITMQDGDLVSAGTAPVTVWSPTEPTPETVILAETPPASGFFTGTINTSTVAVNGDGAVGVTNGDTITVRYLDVDYCGTPNQNVDATAAADCAGPTITNVQAINITGMSADITWDTDENADSLVYYGITPPTWSTASLPTLVLSHVVPLTGLTECTTYYFWVVSTDAAGNSSQDDNGGSWFTFVTGKNVNPSYTSTDTPIPIPDNDPAGATSTIVVADNKTVTDVNVTVNITHTYDGDLTLELIPPGQPAIMLSNRHGGSGNDYTNTIFDDEAVNPISGGAAPFTGSFTPDSALSAADGINAAGNWQLKVTDHAGIDTGNIENWTLSLTYPAQACGPSAQYLSHALLADACAAGGLGDADGIWDPGERIQFSVDVENNGTVALTGISATLTPLTPGVSMTDATASFNDLAVGASGTSLPPHFTVQLPDSLSCGSTVDFHIDIASSEGSYSDTFAQTIGLVIAGGGTVLNESFDAGFPPAGWTISDNLGDGYTWFGDSAADPSGCANTDPNSPLAGIWAALDDDCPGSGVTQDETMDTPLLDLSGATTVSLDFDHYYNNFTTDSTEVQVKSANTGGNWTQVAAWTADTANPQHETIDITTEAAGAADVQVRWHYVDPGAWGWYWYVDNVVVAYTAPGSCSMNVCPLSPPPVPDGLTGQAIRATRMTPNGSQIDLAWDVTTCTARDYHVLYGDLSTVAAYTVGGSACAIGTTGTYSWTGVPAGNLWFVITSDDAGTTEGSWGLDGTGSERSGTVSGQCGMSSIDLAGTCP